MGVKVAFDDRWTDLDNRPEEPEGRWAILCPKCSVEIWRGPGCDFCLHSEYGVAGWILVEAIETREACKIADHTFEIVFESGGGYYIGCLDPHTPQEQEAMMRHTNRRHIPGCLESDELRDMMAGTIHAKFQIVVEGGSYEYPNDVDVWYEITEAELVE